MASWCDFADDEKGRGGRGKGGQTADHFRFSLHLPDDEEIQEDRPIRSELDLTKLQPYKSDLDLAKLHPTNSELDLTKLHPITMEDETLKLQPKSFKPFKSNEEYLQVSLGVGCAVRQFGGGDCDYDD